MPRPDKVTDVAELTENFRTSNAAVLTEYRGLTVSQLTQLRHNLGTTTQYTVMSHIRTLRINHVLLRIFSIPILAPLKDISVHIVKSPRVGWKSAYRRRLLAIHAFLAVAV